MDAPKELTLTCSVDSYRCGWTVVDFLAHRFKYHTATGWERRVLDKRVRVNGTAVVPGHVVSKNDAVQYTIVHAEPAVDERYTVLYAVWFTGNTMSSEALITRVSATATTPSFG